MLLTPACVYSLLTKHALKIEYFFSNKYYFIICGDQKIVFSLQCPLFWDATQMTTFAEEFWVCQVLEISDAFARAEHLNNIDASDNEWLTF